MEIGVAETGLCWQGERPRSNLHVARLHRDLRDRLVASVTMSARLQVADLGHLLQLLGEDPQLLLSTGGLMQAFGPGASRGLRVRDVDFTRDLHLCEGSWVAACQDLDPTAVAPLRHVLETCLHLVRSVGEQKTLEEIRAAAGRAISYDPAQPTAATEAIAELLAGIIQSAGEIALRTGSANLQAWEGLRAGAIGGSGVVLGGLHSPRPAPPSPGNPDIFTHLADLMPFERRLSVLLDYPGSLVDEQPEGLTLILQRLLSHSKEASRWSAACTSGRGRGAFRNRRIARW